MVYRGEIRNINTTGFNFIKIVNLISWRFLNLGPNLNISLLILGRFINRRLLNNRLFIKLTRIKLKFFLHTRFGRTWIKIILIQVYMSVILVLVYYQQTRYCFFILLFLFIVNYLKSPGSIMIFACWKLQLVQIDYPAFTF